MRLSTYLGVALLPGVASLELSESEKKLVKDWQVDMQLSDDGATYEVSFQWTHEHGDAVIIENEKAGDTGRVYKPTDDPR